MDAETKALLNSFKDLPSVLKELKTVLKTLSDRIPRPAFDREGKPIPPTESLGDLNLKKSKDAPLTRDEFNNSLKSAGDLIGAAAVARMSGISPADLTPAGIKGLAIGAGVQIFEQLKANAKVIDEAKKSQKALQDVTNFTSESYDKFAKSISGSAEVLSGLSLTTNDVRDAQKKLMDASPAYQQMMSKSTHKKFGNNMAALAAQWDRLGTPVAITGKTFEHAARQLGMLSADADLSKKKIKGFYATLLKSAQESSQSWKKTQEAATGGMAALSLLGKTMIYNMTELNKATTATGISQEKFLAMAGKYETLEGASAQVGQLHAVLKGTTLGIGEMMTAEPVDRVKKVLGEINVAMKEGRFKLAEGGAMRVAQIKALAKAAGIEELAMDKLLRKKMKVEEIFKASGKIKHPDPAALAAAGKKQLPTEDIIKIPQKTLENEILTQGAAVTDYTKTISAGSAEIAKGMKKFGLAIKDFTGKLTGLQTAINRILPEGADKDKGGLYTQLLFGNIEHFKEFQKTIQEAASAGLGAGAAANMQKQLDIAIKEKKELLEKLKAKKKDETGAAPATGDSTSSTPQFKAEGGDITMTLRLPGKVINDALTQQQ